MIYLYNEFYGDLFDEEVQRVKDKLCDKKTGIVLFDEHGDRTIDVTEAQVAYLADKEARDLFIEAHKIFDVSCEGDWCIGLNCYSPKSGLWTHIPDSCVDALKSYFTEGDK